MNPAQRIRNAFRRLMGDERNDKDARIAALEKELAPFRALADELDPPVVEEPPESGNGADSAVAA